MKTLMVAVNLYDCLTFADETSGVVTLGCDDPKLPTGESNLVMKAAGRLKAETGCTRGAAIALNKVIPTEAGLAGGSSDAAATLVGLDRLWDLNTPAETLESIARDLGRRAEPVRSEVSRPPDSAVVEGDVKSVWL